MKTSAIRHLRRAAYALVLILLASAAAAEAKRPITHLDYDVWRGIHAQALSRDGKFLAYGLFPQQGDGEVIIRNLQTGAEWRQPAGERPAPTPRPQIGEPTEEPPAPPSVTINFTADGRFVVFSTFPTRAEVETAKKDKKKPEDMPKRGMVIFDLATGKEIARVARVKSFQVPEKSAAMAYLRETEPEKAAPPDASAEKPAEPVRRERRKEYGSELVLRDLNTQAERDYDDVLEYSLTKDGALLVYAISSRKEDDNGLYAVAVAGSGVPRALLNGKGRYVKLAWDREQTKLAFLSDKDDAASRRPKLKLYLWERQAAAPSELASSQTPGFRDGYLISDKGNITFSRDGRHVFFGWAPSPPPERDPEAVADDRPAGDLWSWRDDYIQPMQKIRAEFERNRTYRAVYHLAEKQLVQLADVTMTDLTPSEDGLWALGSDNRAYRREIEYDTRYSDTYLVNTLTGERRLVLKKDEGNVTWSPDGKYALHYNGKDWETIAVPGGTITVLTTPAKVAFWREDDDHPRTPPSYGSAGWTRDGKYVLLYDKYDVWRMAPDGSEAVNLTQGFGRKNHLQFRYVRLEADRSDPESRWIDPSKPILLRAEDEETRDTGFYRTSIDAKQPPQKLIMAARNLGTPVKAKDADVLVLTQTSFEEFPDLQITDSSFAKLRPVSDANPQKAQLLWGTSELLNFRNADGVQLKAALYKPENFDPKKKYPMIVYIYEKLSQNVHNFVDPKPGHSINIMYYVSNGYLILTPDIVYTVGHPGQSALKCVLPAIDQVVSRGFVDENAIGIQGHSWGGYQIAYMLTQTNRFRAAEAGAPVSNMFSAYDGIRWGPGLPRQFQYERDQSRIGASPWETPLLYMENSPIFSANRVTTPLLMLHNDADDAVPWYQGIEYYLALRRLGKEVYMFSYNGEPHHLDKRPNQKDYTVRMQQFFDHFLKGAPEPEWMKTGIPFLRRDAEKDDLKKETGVY